MGHISTIYGSIIGLPKYGDIGLVLRRKNKSAIESLPTDDPQWPWIDRGMFLVQDPESPKMYRNQLIIFGASYKEVEMEWGGWLNYDNSLLDTWATDNPLPTSIWSFSGGPREFY